MRTRCEWPRRAQLKRRIAILVVFGCSLGTTNAEPTNVALTQREPVQITVRVGVAMGEAELAAYLNKQLSQSMGDAAVGGVGAAAIVLGPGGFAAAPLAILLLPVAAAEASNARRNAGTINRVLREYDMKGRVDAWLKARTTAIDGQPPRVKVDLLITQYGLIADRYEFCVVAHAELRIIIDEREAHYEPLVIDRLNKTRDAPPPECARVGSFGEQDGRRLRDALDEYALVLGALTLARVESIVRKSL